MPRFIATAEANADPRYKQMIVESSAADIVYTPHFSGVHGNYLRPSGLQAGLDPDDLSTPDKSSMSFNSGKTRPWRDIWSAGQGVGMIDSVRPTADVIATLHAEYEAARRALL